VNRKLLRLRTPVCGGSHIIHFIIRAIVTRAWHFESKKEWDFSHKKNDLQHTSTMWDEFL